MIALSVEHGFSHWLAQATIERGWAMAEQGYKEEGIAQIREGLAGFRAAGTEALRPHVLCLLAEACGETHRIDDGLSALAEALAGVAPSGGRGLDFQVPAFGKAVVILPPHPT